MINTRKHTITLLFLIITTTIATGGSLTTTETIDPQPVAQAENIDLSIACPETISYRKRMRKSSKKKTHQKKIRTYHDMSYEELLIAKDRHIANGSITLAIKYLEYAMKLSTDITKIAEHILELADLFYLDGQFSKAARIYTEFASSYPGNDKMEYALYRAICSSYACILPSDRDQTKTEETVGLTEIFLLQDHFTTYKDQVKTIQIQCYEQLALSECNVCYFYISRDRFNAAEKRLSKIRSNWLTKLPDIEPDILALEQELTTRKETALALQLKIEQASQTELLAQNKKTKRMLKRF